MRLYREVLIESIEQLSDLPDTAILTYAEPDDQPIAVVRAGTDNGLRVWEVTGEQRIITERHLMAWGARFVALVPVEVEEEYLDVRRAADPAPRTLTRYVTEWQS